MKTIDRLIEGEYWIIYYSVFVVTVYYSVFVVTVGICTWLYWPEMFGPESDKLSRLYTVAAVLGVAAGLALLVVIILEVTGRMVLLIPAAWRKAKAKGLEEGRLEGRQEGRQEGRDAERERVRDIIAQFGQVDPETGAIMLDREAQERLRNGSHDAA